MKRILIIAGAITGLLVIAALIVPMLVPTSVYRNQIEQAASEALGVDVTVTGDPRFSILPRIAARIDGVTVANPEGFSADPILQVTEAQANVALLPLLSQKVEIKELVFRDLDIRIETDADGKTNVEYLIPETSEDSEQTFLTTVDRARLENASIYYAGPATPLPIQLQDFTGWASFKGLDQPISSKGSGIINGYDFEYEVALDDLPALDALVDGTAKLDFGIKTDFFQVGYDGTLKQAADAAFPNLVNGNFTASSDQLKILTQLAKDSLPEAALDLTAFEIAGSINQDLTAAPESIIVDLSKFSAETDYADLSFDGRVGIGANMDGAFSINVSDPGKAVRHVPGQLPIKAEALQRIQAEGQITGKGAGYYIDLGVAELRATGAEIDYAGAIDLADLAAPRLDGKVDVKLDRADQLLTLPNELSALLLLLDQVEFSANVAGPAAAPQLSNIRLKQRGPDLSTDYTGAFALSGNTPLDGAMNIRSDNPRAVLAALGTPLAEGETLQSFSLKGETTGTAAAPSLSGIELTIDDTTATGQVTADLASSRPRITANLNANKLDLTPFLGADAQTADTEPSLNEDWDDTPLDLAALNLMDATVTVAAEQVILDQIVLDDALLNTRLDAGRLSAIFRKDNDQPGFKVFQGNWSGDLVLDASRATPTLEIEALADGIAAQDMLQALTGFQSLSGLGDVKIDMTSEGTSLKALVSGLDGTFESDLERGALKGLNLAKLVRDASSLTQLVSSGGLTLASFQDALSPEAETDFSQFIGNLEFTNGVANITNLRIDNPVVGITGSGSINLGARTLDVRLTPRVDVNAAGGGSTLGVDKIPVPLRISGSWTSPNFGLDSSAVQAELTSRLRGQAASEISNRIGGAAGGILGEIVGGGSTTETTPEAEDAPDLEDELRDAALGALFGNRNRNREEPPEEEADN
ncbi:MAG: AsmA family protein [Pseudomonadota bacterium]